MQNEIIEENVIGGLGDRVGVSEAGENAGNAAHRQQNVEIEASKAQTRAKRRQS
jgi:hypothetical protein